MDGCYAIIPNYADMFTASFAMRKQGGKPVLEALATRDKVVGLKQTRRCLAAGLAREVYLACDADPRLTDPVREMCRASGVPVQEGYTLQQLGRAAGIPVGTAALALLAK